MFNGILSSDAQPTDDQAERADDVFNDETCRALRQQGYVAIRVVVPVFTFLLFLLAAALQGVLTILGPWMEVMVGMVLSLVFAVTLIAELRWFGVSFYREAVREMKQDLRREARRLAGDPEAIESRALAENNEPDARPKLAFGLPPEECIPIFAVPVIGLWAASSVPDPLLSGLIFGASIVLSGTMIAFLKMCGTRLRTRRRTHHERH